LANRQVVNAATSKEKVYESLRDEHEARLKKSIARLETEVVALASQLRTKGGLIVTDDRNLQDAFNMRVGLVGIFENNYSRDFVLPTVNDFDEMALEVENYFKTVFKKSFVESDLAVITALKEGSFTRLDVLGANFQAVLADSIYTATISGLPFTDLVDNLKNALVGIEDLGGRPMAQHARTLAHDSLVGMDRSMSAKQALEIGVENYLYFGSVVKDTRDFCQRYVGQIKTASEWEEIASSEDWSGKASSDIFNDAGGYNCGHTLVAVP
jgi:hypothetical protein